MSIEPERVTQADFARRCGVSRKSVTKWKTEGRIVMAGDLVDVAASTEKLRRYRREGLPAGLRDPGARVAAPARRRAAPPAVATMTRAELQAAIEAADMAGPPRDWSDAAQVARMHAAARTLGLEAMQSPVRDDGHHGGWQLRDATTAPGASITDAIVAGYGYELEPFEVIEACRRLADEFADEYPGEVLTADPNGVAALALPHLKAHEHLGEG
jgi:hypothetical protein